MRTFNSYMFRTKDPVIDELRVLVQDSFSGKLTRKELRKIEEDGGPRASTSAGWFFGKVRRPQNPGIEATGRALGYHRPWTKMTAADRAAYVKAGRMKNGHG
jgi:hypothetical protein